MWLWIAAIVKPGRTSEDVVRKRKEWVEQGKENLLKAKCKSAQRYVVLGASPPQVFWLVETEDPSILNLLTEHFGDVWELHTHLVAPQAIAEVVK